ncbi:hypothetical protein MKJ04_14340 [Pontibacter sp. E15-1]|uniref:hypothetical protein n=1 Tax=Pontibacter sp. E15-1 TaxID=2919918 RepID=UPI001F4F78F6|nr:hypothetical protein [Pontibacter sp. E15-1]MCJ8166022.1 hypothetical protein [Pontibacter sp. E15-1]
MLLEPLIKDFVSEFRTLLHVELYNTAGLRHELVSYLDGALSLENYGVQVERKATAVVLEPYEAVSQEAILDIYIFERAGKGQFCIQVMAVSSPDQGSWAEASKNIRFLEELSAHGFRETGFFFAYQQPGQHLEIELIFQRSEPSYSMVWQELTPASHDSKGPWMYCFIQPGTVVPANKNT